MAITIDKPKELEHTSDTVWQLIVHDIKKDKEFMKLCGRYNETERIYNSLIAESSQSNHNDKYITAANNVADKYARKMSEIYRMATVRLVDFGKWWLKKYGSSSLTAQEAVSILEGEERNKFILRINTVLFLADFIEDCFIEMNKNLKAQFPDAKYEPLKDFFDIKDRLSSYMSKILDAEGDNFRDLFDEHAASIKMTIYNKVNGFLNANEKRVLEEEDAKEAAEAKAVMDRRQLTIQFEDEEEGGEN